MAETIQIPNNIPVSWLSRQTSADADMLFLVSVPSEKTETQYMSKYYKHSDFCSQLSSAFDLGYIHQWVDKLCSEYAPVLDNAANNTLCCATAPDPFIISSITQSAFNIVSLSGYRLSSGMDTVFKSTVFDEISAVTINATSIHCNDMVSTWVGTKAQLASVTPVSNMIYFCTDQ